MRAALVAVALVALPGCFVRPWAIEESDRIEHDLQFEVDDADQEAFEGISAPGLVSPGAGQAIGAQTRAEPKPKRKKGSGSKGSSKQVAFSELTPSSKGSKKR